MPSKGYSLIVYTLDNHGARSIIDGVPTHGLLRQPKWNSLCFGGATHAGRQGFSLNSKSSETLKKKVIYLLKSLIWFILSLCY